MSNHRAIALVFAVHGAAGGSLATRIPWIQDHLQLSPGVLGLALLCPSVGAFIGMPTASRLAHRIGARTATRMLIALWCAAVALPSLAPAPVWLFAAFLLYGATAGMSDVVMNGHAVTLERRLGRSIMSGLHGMWCVGSLIAGGAGILAAHAGIDARLHLGVAAVILLSLGLLVSRDLMPDDAEPEGPAPRRFALPSRAILAIGVVGFCGTFAEGSSADWAAVYLSKVTHAGPGLAAASFTIFMLFMASTRLVADHVVGRIGQVSMVRYGGVVAAVGGVLVVTAQSAVQGITGFALIGMGVAAVVPLVFAAAGNQGRTPGEGVAGVATITYLSGLTAPAITGWVAGATSYRVSFAVITCAAVLMSVLAGTLGRGGAASSAAETAKEPVPAAC
ncbi:MFS transporter [Actinomadura barringtoniae]|uniref:MFS transporter n=1 Tax=Actinomadura barringtoniae TaxID=1427535 RepID=A0A939T1G4_9ACTN|nr:MFS transporter [Actinomadura barringtoniae]MBO2447516.1 MFS transporter [Actinomadura barringtoniae]